MSEEIQVIRGGWGSVPSHLKCKTDLAGMRAADGWFDESSRMEQL